MRQTIVQKRKRRVLITGLPHFARKMAMLISNDEWQPVLGNLQVMQSDVARRLQLLKTLLAVPTCDLVYQMGGPTVHPRLLKRCIQTGRPVVVHWVGSDVTSAAGDALVGGQNRTGAVVHWVDAPWLQRELEDIGLSTSMMPSCAISGRGDIALPEGPLTVLSYLPANRFEFYRGPFIARLAGNHPECMFLVVGSDGEDKPKAANLRYLGWRDDMGAVFEQSHVLLRFPEHDGLSSMVVEALACGRHVVWNYPLPGCIPASSEAAVEQQIATLTQAQMRGALRPNDAGRSFVEREFAVDKVQSKIRAAFDDIAASAQKRRSSRSMSHRLGSLSSVS